LSHFAALVDALSRRPVTSFCAEVFRATIPGYAKYESINYGRTQQIGAEVASLGCDGLVAPNARWACENLVIYMDNVPLDRAFAVIGEASVNWIDWARRNRRLPPAAD
jgi:hypothetical protein